MSKVSTLIYLFDTYTKLNVLFNPDQFEQECSELLGEIGEYPEPGENCVEQILAFARNEI